MPNMYLSAFRDSYASIFYIWSFLGVCMKKLLLVFVVLLASCASVSVQQNSGCSADADCVPSSCCHSSSCVSKNNAPDCSGMFCTQVCTAGTLDCGGSCACVNKKCVAKNLYEASGEIPIM